MEQRQRGGGGGCVYVCVWVGVWWVRVCMGVCVCVCVRVIKHQVFQTTSILLDNSDISCFDTSMFYIIYI